MELRKISEKEQKKAAKEFYEHWKGKGYEKGQAQPFWLELLRKVYGVSYPEQAITFEDQVLMDHTSFIDGYIGDTKVLIEQKSIDKDLNKAIKQSDGSMKTPFQQAKRYSAELPYSKRPRWIVTCNFQEFRVYDMEKPNGEPEVILLKDLPKEFYRLNFLTNMENEHIKKEMEISIKAGDIVGAIYDNLLKAYADPTNPHSLESLNILCVRLVFCFYAEDAGLFHSHLAFHDYLKKHRTDARNALINLFKVLDQKPEDRSPYLDDDLAAFPYVNGGLFSNEEIEIPKINETVLNLIIKHASEDFDWSEISPTIFGAVFEATLNPETRRKKGMHYTSFENIHKVIDPLFLDELKEEFEHIKTYKVHGQKKRRLDEFREKLGSLTFLDPAAGSGNFLTETFISLRRLENEALLESTKGQGLLDTEEIIKVSIDQFNGIEINDFACTVARTALWIAESQMMIETEEIVHKNLNFLPLKTTANIVEENALVIDWNDVVDKTKLNYIMGNPPFVARAGRLKKSESSSKGMLQDSQKKERFDVFGEDLGNVDYVACWFKKASLYTVGTDIHCAFVATDSICQGQQIYPIWSNLLKDNINIDFAYKFFKWGSESSKSATVYVIIIGFSHIKSKDNLLFNGSLVRRVEHINPYLIDTASDVLINTANNPLWDVPTMAMGNQPIDDGAYLFSKEEMLDFIKSEPQSRPYFHKWLDGKGFLNNDEKYCLWLGECTPRQLKSMPKCYKLVQYVKDYRAKSNRKSTQKLAETPTRFQTENMPDSEYIAIPEVSSGNRRYIPMAFLNQDVLCSNKLRLMPNANLYHFGVLQSNVHMAWTRTVCGFYGPSYQYSIKVVYNNFPWPNPTEKQKQRIMKTAAMILEARAKYPDSSLSDLYDEVSMPSELRKAHQLNDIAVMNAYGFDVKETTESKCVEELFKLYNQKINS